MAESLARRQHAVKVERGAAGDALSGLVVQVLRLAAALTEAGDALAAPAGQSSARWQVLAAVEHAPHSVASVARRLGHSRQSVQRLADLVVADGLARYRPNPGHRRAKLLELTADGLATLRTIQAAQAHWARQLADQFDPAELESATAVLTALDGRLSAQSESATLED